MCSNRSSTRTSSHPWPKSFITGLVTTLGLVLAFKFVSLFIPAAGNEQGQLIALIVTIGGVFVLVAVVGVVASLFLPREKREEPNLRQIPFTAGMIAAAGIVSGVIALMRSFKAL